MVATRDEKADLGYVPIHEYIRKWGDSSSEAILEEHCQLFCAPGIEGFIGYRVERGTAVAFGDPVCAPENRPWLAKAFQDYCHHSGLRFIYLLASEPFASWAYKNGGKVMMEVCEELIFDPHEDPLVGKKSHRLRNKVNHTQNLNLAVKEYTTPDPKLEAALQRVGDLWLGERKGPQIHLGALQLFDHRFDRRWFYVEDPDGTISSVALLRRLEGKEGWFIKFLITTPTAPRGCSELLMTAILKILRDENCRYLSVGVVPAPELGLIQGLGNFYKSLTQNIFAVAKWVFHLGNRKVYWEQFRPTGHRSFLVFSNRTVGVRDLWAILKALNMKL